MHQEGASSERSIIVRDEMVKSKPLDLSLG